MGDSADAAAGAAGAGQVGASLIRFERVGYGHGGAMLLDGVSLDIRTGGPLVLVGPNGAGKTTLLRLAMGLIAPASGRIVELAAQPGRAAPRKAFLFQKPVMLRRTAAQNIAFALAAAGRPASHDAVAALLDRVGLGGFAHRPARRLSGGEQQRLALARALARAPDILLLDEPTASLDPQSTHAVEGIIAAVAAAGVKVVMATHDLGEARRIGGEIVLLARGRVVEHTTSDRFFSAPATEAARRFIDGGLLV